MYFQCALWSQKTQQAVKRRRYPLQQGPASDGRRSRHGIKKKIHTAKQPQSRVKRKTSILETQQQPASQRFTLLCVHGCVVIARKAGFSGVEWNEKGKPETGSPSGWVYSKSQSRCRNPYVAQGCLLRSSCRSCCVSRREVPIVVFICDLKRMGSQKDES